MDIDVNDLDDLFEHRMHEDDNEDLARQDDLNEQEQNIEEKVVPVKIRVKKPQPKLDPARLKGPRGLSVLPTWFENIQLKGKGHESEDLNAVINRLEQWTHRLFPRYTFDDAIDKLEKLGKKTEVKTILKRIRLGIDDDFVTQTEYVVDEPPSTQNDVFDRIFNTVDIFPVTSTPGVRNSELTEEQRQRMMHNRMLAEERRQAKIRARQEQELNVSLNVNTTMNYL